MPQSPTQVEMHREVHCPILNCTQLSQTHTGAGVIPKNVQPELVWKAGLTAQLLERKPQSWVPENINKMWRIYISGNKGFGNCQNWDLCEIKLTVLSYLVSKKAL